MKQTQRKKSLKLNVIFNAVYQIFILLVPFITSPYISRMLLPSGIGSYSYALSLTTYFATFAAFGFLDYGTTQIAKKRDSKKETSEIFWELCFCKLVFTLFICLIYSSLILGNVFSSAGYPLNTKAVFLALGMNILVNGFDATFLFQGLEDFGPLCLRNFFVRLINMILIFVLINGPEDFIAYVLIMSGSNILLGLFSFIGINKRVAKPTWKNPHLFTHIKNSFVFFIPTASITFFPIISKSLLGFIKNDTSVSGYFEQADKLTTLIITIINSVDAIMMSRMTYLYATNDKEQIKQKNKKAIQFYLLLSIPAFLGLIAINKYFTVGFFGNDYEESVNLVYLLSPKVILMPLTCLLGAIYYVPSNKLWKRNFIYIGGIAFEIIANLFFISYLSATGAAIASTLTELLLCVLFISFSKKEVCFKESKDTAIKAFDAGIIMFIILQLADQFLNNNLSNIAVSIIAFIIGVLVYVSILLLFKEEVSSFYFHFYLKKLKSRKKDKSKGSDFSAS